MTRHQSVSTQETGELPRPGSAATRVKHIMTVDVVSVSPTASVGRIARLMHERAISGLPVVDLDKKVVGMVTDLDLILLNTRIEAPHFLPSTDAFPWRRPRTSRGGSSTPRARPRRT